MQPMYIDADSVLTWSSTYVVPSVNNGLPPHPSNNWAMTNSRTGPKVDDFPLIQLSSRKVLCGANGGFDRPVDSRPRPMSSSLNDTPRQMLSELLLCMLMPGFASPVKCGTIKTSEPIPMMTAPTKKKQITTGLNNNRKKTNLTNANPHGNVSTTSQVADKNHRYNVANFIAGRNQSRVAGWNLKAFLNRCNHWINVSRA